MRIKHIGFFLKDSIFNAERVMDELVGYCEMEHTKQGTIYHLQIVVDGEIVRCKDCKYWIPSTVESIKDGSYINQPHPCEINCFGNKGEWRTADDFCSRGEKK